MTAGSVIEKPVAAHTTPPLPRRRRLVRTEALWAVATAVLAFLVGAWSLRLWAWTPGMPFGLVGDSTQISMQLKDIYDHGWYWHNTDIGFPFGQNGSFFPELNAIHVAMISAANTLFSSPYTAGVLFFVASFPLTGIAGYLLARSQGLSRMAGLLLGVLFANAPGHAERYGHLYLSAYWVVAIAMWLVLEVARGRSLLSRGADGRPRWRGARTLVTMAAIVIVGLSGVYYVGFTLVLLFVVTVARRIGGSPRDLLPGGLVMVSLGVMIAIPLAFAKLGTAGTLITGRVPAQRSFTESEMFAGKLMDLLLPWPGHRNDLAAYVTWGYRATTDATVETSALGIVGVCGFVALVFLTLVALLRGRALSGDLGRWSALTWLSFLLYTVGGLGAFIAFFFTGQMRTWSRMELYILLLALLAVGYWLTRLQARRGAVVAAVLTATLVFVGTLDQTNPAEAPDHDAIAAEMASLDTYVGQLQSATSPGCGDFQIPVTPYPESAGSFDMNGYDQLKPYLATSDLKFSAGGMMGTADADWQQAVEAEDLDALAAQLVSLGYCSLEVATRGFEDPTAVISRLTASYGRPVAQTDDGEFVAFDIRSAGAAGEGDATLRTRTLEPVVVNLRAYDVESRDDTLGQYVGPNATVSIANMGDSTVRLDVTMRVHGIDGETREATVEDPNGRVVASGTITGGEAVDLSFPADAARGTTAYVVKISGDGVKDDANRTVSAFVSGISASSSADVRVASLQAQAITGWVLIG